MHNGNIKDTQTLINTECRPLIRGDINFFYERPGFISGSSFVVYFNNTLKTGFDFRKNRKLFTYAKLKCVKGTVKTSYCT